MAAAAVIPAIGEQLPESLAESLVFTHSPFIDIEPQASVESNLTPPSPSPRRRCVLVCQHRSCTRNGSEAVLEAFREAKIPGVFTSASDCMGQCASGPTVQVTPDITWYCRVKPSDVPTIVEQHLYGDQPVERLLHSRFHPRLDAFHVDE